VQLTGALPNLSSNIEIEGPGADQLTVRRDTGGDYCIFTVTSGSAVSISGITLSNGRAAGDFNGGGIRNDGTLTVSDSTISASSAGNAGGGILNFGTLTITGSTISGNSAGTSGGGIYSQLATLKITNSTISGNSSSSFGGGVSTVSGPTVIEHSTITKNTALSGGGSGVSHFGNARTEVLSTIISANPGTDVEFSGTTTNTFVSNGYNLIGNGNATGAFSQTTHDQIGVTDPGLDPLGSYGGPT
jgi:predicted outer membrane repeat protein